jgi:hypothetical protein
MCPQTSVPDAVFRRLRANSTTVVPYFDASASGVAPTEAIRPHLAPDTARKLVDREDLQQMLASDKDIQSLVRDLVRMNQSVHRNHVREEPSNKIKGVSVSNCVSGNVDCLFLRLHENAELCVLDLTSRSETATVVQVTDTREETVAAGTNNCAVDRAR